MSSPLTRLPVKRWKTTSKTYDAGVDCGQTYRHENASASTFTLPNDADDGDNVTIVQKAAGQVTFVAAPGGTLTSYGNAYKTAGLHAGVTAICTQNDTGAAAEWTLFGATAV